MKAANQSRQRIFAIGNPMVDRFLVLPEEAREFIPGKGFGMVHLQPQEFNRILEELQEGFPEYVNRMVTHPGGGALTMLAVLSKQNLPVQLQFSGAVGSDTFGELVGDYLNSRGIGAYLQESTEPTGKMLYCMYRTPEGYGGYSILASPGAASRYQFREDLIPNETDLFLEGYLAPAAGVWTSSEGLLQRTRRLIIDAGSPAAAGRTAAVISQALKKSIPCILFGTHEELLVLQRYISEEELTESQGIIVEKQGAKGAEVRSGGVRCHCPSELQNTDVPKILTVGAGDALCGGFLAEVYRQDGKWPLSDEMLYQGLVQGIRRAEESISRLTAACSRLLS